ncbi:5-hydroxytryptamine receptor 1E [Clupea harengus]|uniref:5-hydroxytryptamine receptor 1E n=1 Tax=Clupea harengus TaxID=7950 RepID=A0A6P8GMV0_CLUHA|nr:5-hydroxytryptamine receptor 1E [Clupea harengus]
MNISSCSLVQEQKLFDAGTVLIVSFLTVLTLITALLNCTVILAICTTRKLHLPANYLICSLAITDLLVATLVMPLSILYIATETWMLGHIVCEAWLSMDMICCTCSILHLCAIAVDRHWSITSALEYTCKRTPRLTAVMVTIVWTLSVLISVPPLFWRSNRCITQCTIEHDHVTYTIYSTFGAFYIPMALILILYCRIFVAAKTLYQRRSVTTNLCSNGEKNGRFPSVQFVCVSQTSTPNPGKPIELVVNKDSDIPCPNVFQSTLEEDKERSQLYAIRERRAAQTLGLILGAFVLCWLPFFVKELMVGFGILQPSQHMSNFLTWLGYTNSLINPLLYTSFNEDFKQSFKRLLQCRRV